MLRGAFGSIFRRIACKPECEDARTCEVRARCAYARTFEPSAALGGGPSGFADWPRPFVFRARHLDGCTVAPGAPFHFDVHLFQVRDPAINDFVRALAEFATEGVGPGRARAEMTCVEQLAPDGVVVRRVSEGRRLCGDTFEASEVLLDSRYGAVERLSVSFLTPTELKHEQQVARRPEFGVLMARIRDRVSTLSTLYGAGPLAMDFGGFGRRASEVAMTRCEIQQVEVTRLSARTGQRHSLGGFVGEAEYAGDLGEFLPFLEVARFTGVGRQTTWGKGEIEVVRD
jgi:hypothetical protein